MPLSDLEVALITGCHSIPSNGIDDVPTTTSVVRDVVDGQFKDVLTGKMAAPVLSLTGEWTLDLPLEQGFAFEIPSSFSLNETDSEMLRLALAVACLNAFAQENWTGPNLEFQASSIISAHAPAGSPAFSDEELNQKAISELALGGEPAYHLMKAALLFRLSQLLLRQQYNRTPCVTWWRRRAIAMHQHLLDEIVSLPATEIPSVPSIVDLLPHSSPDLVGQLILEEGLMLHHLGKDKQAYDSFSRAAELTGLKYELSGALGKRTKFQQNELSQLVLFAKSRDRSGADNEIPGISDLNIVEKAETVVPETLPLNDDTLLEQTEYSTTSQARSKEGLHDLDPNKQPALHPLDQCILLGMCLNVRNTSPNHGLTSEQMMPYVSRVLSHPQNWSVHTMALLLRSRLEASRTRTVERSTLQLAQLVEQMPTNESLVRERLLYLHCLPSPSKWRLEKELALRYMSLGVVRSALEIFERLEMWEEVVKCWSSMERPDKGILIIKDLLEGRKQESDATLFRSKGLKSTEQRRHFDSSREAKLWCLLGDIEPQEALQHYERAWQVSGETSGRAIRSLGGYHFARNNFTEATECLQKAVAINPLLSRSWFILGCACVRIEKWVEARDAFSRCVAIDDEDGESWNNLASVYLRMPRIELPGGISDTANTSDENDDDNPSQEPTATSIPTENKLLAFRALKQGLKFTYDNWRMWANYMIVSVDVGELSEACRALGRIVTERSEKDGAAAVDLEVLDRLVNAASGSNIEGELELPAESANPNAGPALSRRVYDLIQKTILPRISSSPRVYRAYARLLASDLRWDDAMAASLNAYRLTPAGSGQAISDTQTWRNAVVDVEEVIDALRDYGPRAEKTPPPGETPEANPNPATFSRVWLNQARSILRTFLGRHRRDFEGEHEFDRLQELAAALKNNHDEN